MPVEAPKVVWVNPGEPKGGHESGDTVGPSMAWTTTSLDTSVNLGLIVAHWPQSAQGRSAKGQSLGVGRNQAAGLGYTGPHSQGAWLGGYQAAGLGGHRVP